MKKKQLRITQLIVVLSDGSTITMTPQTCSVSDLFGSRSGTLDKMEKEIQAELQRRKQ